MTLKTHLFANDGEMNQLFFGANQDAQLSDLISMEGEVDGTFQIEVPSTTFSPTQSEYTYCIWWHRTGPLLMASNSLPLTWKHPLDRIVNAQPVLKFYIAIGSVKRGEDPTSLVSAMFPQCVMPLQEHKMCLLSVHVTAFGQSTVNGQRSTVNGQRQDPNIITNMPTSLPDDARSVHTCIHSFGTADANTVRPWYLKN